MSDKMIVKRMILTLLIILGYGFTWIIIELFIEGVIRDKLVDNIMLLLFMPIAWLAAESLINKRH